MRYLRSAVRHVVRVVLVCIGLGVAHPAVGAAQTGVTNDPTRLEMVLLSKRIEVTAVNPTPVYDVRCRPIVVMGDRCVLEKGTGIQLLGADKKYVLAIYFNWSNNPRNTCRQGTMFLWTRGEFRGYAAPRASARIPPARLREIVARLRERGRGR